MFELSRRYIKTGFVFFLVGMIMGLYMIVEIYVLGSWPSQHVITAHVHVLLFGFIISIIMGVAIWMFPRPKDQKGYSPLAAEAAYWLLTLGTTVRFAAELAIAHFPGLAPLKAAIVAGSVSQMASGIIFVINIWSRVRPVGKQT